jgi:hypothetical protein
MQNGLGWLAPFIPYFAFVGLVLLISFVGWVIRNAKQASLYRQAKSRIEKLDQEEAKLNNDRKALEILVAEKSKGFPFLASAYAEYLHLQDMKTAEWLRYKSHPAKKAAEEVKKIAAKRREAEKLWRTFKYQIEYYESLFPWLIDLKGEEFDELVEESIGIVNGNTECVINEGDPARRWLADAEYRSLPNAKKYQLALNRYWKKKKTRWEIGRDYERYVGFLYERKGHRVLYQGIIEGFSDLGRDIIALAPDGVDVEIAQCKYWSQQKKIHEKHIFQLFGTKVAYEIEHPLEKVTAAFYTSTLFSDRAKEFADKLGITLYESFPIKPYPSIKCNISQRSGERIYHLPFDQQYDRTLIDADKLECYVATVEEAESLGFRRAFKWHGNESSN